LQDLDSIECPVLLASPQFDRILPAERHAPRYRREIPGVESRVLPGCGHVPMWDDTRLIVRTISEFVDRHAALGVDSSSVSGGVAAHSTRSVAFMPLAAWPGSEQNRV
jgi:hypothetical protein